MSLLGKIKWYLKHVQIKKEKVAIPVLQGELLKDRTAFITGGTSGIGLATAMAFARNGAAVAITGRSRARIDAAVDAIRSELLGANVAGIMLDSSTNDEDAFSLALDEAEAALGKSVDALVNNAGVIAGGMIPTSDMGGFDITMNTNLRGAYFLSQAFARKLVIGKRSGNTLNVCSSSSLRPAVTPYTMSKWGLRSLTLGLAKQLAPYDIVVNGIAPGQTATPMLASDDDNIAHQGVPTGRYVTPEEIANMAVVLVSDLSRMVIGDIVYMTGGSGTITFEDMDYGFRL